MKSARGSVLWVKAGNVRRTARRHDRMWWDSRPVRFGGKGTYRKVPK